VRLSFNEILAHAASFAKTYANATYEKGETQTFYNDFFAIIGVERRSVARYEKHVRKLNNRSGFIDLFWPRILLVEQKSAGRDLAKTDEENERVAMARRKADTVRDMPPLSGERANDGQPKLTAKERAAIVKDA